MGVGESVKSRSGWRIIVANSLSPRVRVHTPQLNRKTPSPRPSPSRAREKTGQYRGAEPTSIGRATSSACFFFLIALFGILGISVFAPSKAHAQTDQTDEQLSPTSLEISVLSYNVHGLPAWIAWDEPGVRSPRIGKLLNAYDVVLLQEDFVYHALLAREASHAIIRRGNGARSKLFGLTSPVCGRCGSGLTFLAGFSPNVLLALERQPFLVCSGWLRSSQDCWASKGLLHARLQLPNQAHIDFYTLHLDAGLSDQDRAARQQQLQFVQQHIETHSEGRAVVIGGDFNLDSHIAEDRGLLASFSASLQLRNSHAWSRPFENRPEVDYILYKSGGEVQLELLEAGNAEEFVLSGRVQKEKMEPLSDHPAIMTRFRVAKSG